MRSAHALRYVHTKRISWWGRGVHRDDIRTVTTCEGGGKVVSGEMNPAPSPVIRNSVTLHRHCTVIGIIIERKNCHYCHDVPTAVVVEGCSRAVWVACSGVGGVSWVCR